MSNVFSLDRKRKLKEIERELDLVMQATLDVFRDEGLADKLADMSFEEYSDKIDEFAEARRNDRKTYESRKDISEKPKNIELFKDSSTDTQNNTPTPDKDL